MRIPPRSKGEPYRTNASITGPNPLKPHIVKRNGWWRVSPMHRTLTLEQRKLWIMAHTWVAHANATISFNNFAKERKHET